MTTTTITNFRQDIFEYVRSAVEDNNVIDVTTKNGDAVLMSKEDYEAMRETFELLNVPGMSQRFEEAMKTPMEECDKFEW